MKQVHGLGSRVYSNYADGYYSENVDNEGANCSYANDYVKGHHSEKGDNKLFSSHNCGANYFAFKQEIYPLLSSHELETLRDGRANYFLSKSERRLLEEKQNHKRVDE